MKIQIKNLEPNPYRNLEKYPINKIKVEDLKTSIEQTGFWDNILARPKDNNWDCGIYELAYGHNRLIALRELGIEEIDIPIKELSNANMVRILALENKEQEDMTESILIETVQVIKKFLSDELYKCKTYNDFSSYESVRTNFSEITSEPAFRKLKGAGVGINTIMNFLGHGWKHHKIQHALEIINSSEFEQQALEQFESTYQADAFKKNLKIINKERKERDEKPITKKKQIKLAEKTREQIDERKKNGGLAKGNGLVGGQAALKAIGDIMRQELDGADEFTTKLNEFKNELNKISKDTGLLANRIAKFNGDLNELGVDHLTSLSSFIVLNNFSQLFTNANTLAGILGLNINQLKQITA